jgi:butyrate response factor 1
LATLKKPKKNFKNEEERDNFVRQYQMKKKTEMCRNWEITGKCKFQDQCSFAHGKHELVKKVHLPSNFKTKICK